MNSCPFFKKIIQRTVSRNFIIFLYFFLVSELHILIFNQFKGYFHCEFTSLTHFCRFVWYLFLLGWTSIVNLLCNAQYWQIFMVQFIMYMYSKWDDIHVHVQCGMCRRDVPKSSSFKNAVWFRKSCDTTIVTSLCLMLTVIIMLQ